jgi:hypothetical protein
MILFGGSTQAFCGVKTDRYTRARCEAQHVTCRACLTKALTFYEKGVAAIRRQIVLSFACPCCDAEAGKSCLSLDKRWQAERCRTAGVLNNGWRKTPHPERVALARAK